MGSRSTAQAQAGTFLTTQSVAALNDTPRGNADVEFVDIGTEAVLVSGWEKALVLNPTGAAIWRHLNGDISVRALARRLAAESGADSDLVTKDVLIFLDHLRTEGFLDGDAAFAVPSGEPSIDLVANEPVRVGSVLDEFEGFEGTEPDVLSDLSEGSALLIKWNPHCGYCAAIALDLSELRLQLEHKGAKLLLVSIGDIDVNRRAVESAAQASGIELPAVFGPIERDPFPSVGTPSAYHLDSDRRVVSPTAHGSDDVLALARHLSGAEWDPPTDSEGKTVRYLTLRGGMCGPDVAPEPMRWNSVRVYRLSDHHVGIRIDSEATGRVLDRLFPYARVEDPRAGHSYSVSLAGWWEGGGAAPPTGDGRSGGRPSPSAHRPTSRALNLFLPNGEWTPLRTRDPARALRALLSRLGSDLGGVEAQHGGVRVSGRAAVAHGQAVLLPREADGFFPRLQPLLARLGFSMVDVQSLVVDLATGDLVVGEPQVSHDAGVLDSLTVDLRHSASERRSVMPGRYPLRAWCVVRYAVEPVSVLTPAEAAAAVISSVLDTVDIAPRLQELGAMFTSEGLRCLAIWYDSEQQFNEVLKTATAMTMTMSSAPEKSR